MTQRTFSAVAGTVFSLVVLLHIARLFYGWHVTVGSAVIPMWLSWGAIPLAGYLAYQGFRLRNKSQ